MGALDPGNDDELLVAHRAADWLRRLPTADAAERAAFVSWLKESPRHVREVLLASAWDRALDNMDPQRRVDLGALWVSASREVVELRPALAETPGESSAKKRDETTVAPRERRPLHWLAGLAAAVMLAVGVWTQFRPAGLTYATDIGEQRSLALDEGSMIYLNARSRVRVDYSSGMRDVYLLDGQATFKVRHDPDRPFRVHVDDVFIQAVGTQFDVHRQARRTTVAVIEGRVKVSSMTPSGEEASGTASAGKTVPVAAGEEVVIAPNGNVSSRELVNVAQATAWRQRRLVFRNDTLAEMAEEFNRYNRSPQIRVEGDLLRSRRFNGVFDADDSDSLLRFLGSADGVEVVREANQVVIRNK